jgi:hypothetical protein
MVACLRSRIGGYEMGDAVLWVDYNKDDHSHNSSRTLELYRIIF